MKVEIKEITVPPAFRPYSITLTVESLVEERILAELYNYKARIPSVINNQSASYSHPAITSEGIKEVLESVCKYSYNKVFGK